MLPYRAGERWQGTAEARNELCKIHPLNLQLKAVLFPLAVALVVFVAVLSSGLDREKLPELTQMLTPVTAQYFTEGISIWFCNMERKKCMFT